MASGFVCILTNRPRGVLYIGVTPDLSRRIYEHKNKILDGFSSRYGLARLVFYEEYPLFMDAVQREKNLKRWQRDWKIALIEKDKQNWEDLYYSLM